jgi:hypothetical protein
VLVPPDGDEAVNALAVAIARDIALLDSGVGS